MHERDVSTIVVKKATAGNFLKTLEMDWLRYLGFSDADLAKEEIELIVQADYSKKHKQPFIGIAKKR